jgi:hypothetical protein
MSKTWKERVLYAASNEVTIDRTTLRRRMRIPSTEMDNRSFDGTVMRAARTAVNEGLLKRKENGVYAITKKGVKAVA